MIEVLQVLGMVVVYGASLFFGVMFPILIFMALWKYVFGSGDD